MATILIIESDEEYLQTIKTILEFQCHEVITASDFSVAARLYRETPTDVVLTDMLANDRNSIAGITELRQFDPEVNIIEVSAAIGDYQKTTKIIGVNRSVQHYFFQDPPL